MGQDQANNILIEGPFQTSQHYPKDSFQLGGGTKMRGDKKTSQGWLGSVGSRHCQSDGVFLLDQHCINTSRRVLGC